MHPILLASNGPLPALVSDLALILVVAAVTTILFKKLKQPLVLGYILAGLIVGPEFNLTPTVTDQSTIKVWGNIGVIFLLFSLGLEFSFKKLIRVGGSVSITAMVEITLNILIGFSVGKLLGWKFVDCLFLGGMLAASSTTIILRALEELQLKTKQFASIVFGVLIVEDIVVILILVILPTIAISQQFEGTEMLFTLLKLGFFLMVWFIAGIYIVPSFLKAARKMMDDETLLLFAIGMCLVMVILATQAGFSAELGAFIMGSIFAETTSAERIEHIIKSVKQLFGAVFFISIGMMIDLDSIKENILPILILSVVVIVGKFFTVTTGALLSGQSLKQSIQVGTSMGQIGEFAFIIATLGLSLNVISEFLFPIAVGVSALTTFTTPYIIKSSDGINNFLRKILPKKFLVRLDKYASNTQKMKTTNEWQVVIKDYLALIIINSLVIIAIILLAIVFLKPALRGLMENKFLAAMISLIITLIITSPFFWALTIRRPRSLAYKELWINKKYSTGPLFVIESLRLILGLVLMSFLLNNLMPGNYGFYVAMAVIIVSVFLFRRRLQHFYSRIEKRFLLNLNEREKKENEVYNFSNPDSPLTPWDAHLAEFEIKKLSPFIGIKLQDLKWREEYGINVALIERGDKAIYTPGRDNMLFPGDIVNIIGTDEQLNKFKPVIEAEESFEEKNKERNGDKIVLRNIMVDEYNKLKGKSIKESNIRELTKGLVVGIERDNERILNPSNDFVFQWEDIIWIVGDRKAIREFKNLKKRK